MRHKIATIPYQGLRQILAAPFIIGMAIPMVIFDFFIEIYHHFAFPLYGIELNERSRYIRIDRHKLSYLSGVDKVWCAYCGYANGLAAYIVKIAGDTEAYWCGIKHSEKGDFVPQPHQKDFLPYGDEQAYNAYVDQKFSDTEGSVAPDAESLHR